MLATFVIGLREGLEAALIVGIIAAFLKQNGRANALRTMWIGVAVAVLLCLAVGVVLQSVNSALPQRQQEMLECVVAAIAVVMVSYMVLWMRAHSRSLKSDLHRAAGGALATGSATALVLMAFLAVFREGFETAVFLLAAFQTAVSPAAAATGAVLGIVIALGLGYLIYRGGVRLNLSRFFRITGVVLVLVAAGLVISTLRAAYEAGWLIVGQQHAVSLALIARPGTVQESLLTGVLGIRSSMPVIEVVAYLLYLVPMLAVVLWPARRALTSRQLGRTLAAVAAAALVTAGALIVLAPSGSTGVAAPSLPITSSVSGLDAATGAPVASTAGGLVTATVDPGLTTLRLAGDVVGQSALHLSGHAGMAGLPDMSAAVYIGSAVTTPFTASGLPTTLTLDQVAAIGGGRLPIGLSNSADQNATVAAAYLDSWTPTVTIDTSTGTVVGLSVSKVRTVIVKSASGGAFPGGTLSTTTLAATPSAIDGQLAAAAGVSRSLADHEVLGEVIPGLLTAFAVILLGFSLRHWVRRRPVGDRTAQPVRSGPPAVSVPVSVSADHERLAPLSHTGG